MPFDEIGYQPKAATILRRIVERGHAAHAYLFHGPPGSGKREAARLFAQAQNCEGGAGDPCGQCRACDQIARSMDPDAPLYPDLVHLAPGRFVASDGKKQASDTIVVDAVRQLRQSLYNAPLVARRRVVVVHEADKMQPAAQNAFLKTLEEPLEKIRTTFLLLSARPQALLPTIRSRCHAVFFAPVPAEAIVRRLLSAGGLEEASAALWARLADGNLQAALTLAADPDASPLIAERADWLTRWEAVIAGPAAGYAEFEAEGRKRDEMPKLIDLLIGWHRDLLVVQSGGDPRHVVNLDRLDALRAAAATLDGPEIVRRIERLVAIRGALDVYIRGDLAMDALLADILVSAKLPAGRADSLYR
ncbi:MAG: AAA family ATPase [Myxococcales bacterium]|nr:MAG: AAA family ATPase [Myxococcales bacterium]